MNRRAAEFAWIQALRVGRQSPEMALLLSSGRRRRFTRSWHAWQVLVDQLDWPQIRANDRERLDPPAPARTPGTSPQRSYTAVQITKTGDRKRAGGNPAGPRGTRTPGGRSGPGPCCDLDEVASAWLEPRRTVGGCKRTTLIGYAAMLRKPGDAARKTRRSTCGPHHVRIRRTDRGRMSPPLQSFVPILTYRIGWW